VKITRLDVPQCSVGEGPVWDVPSQQLYWIDILEKAVFRYDPASGATQRWSVPSYAEAFRFVSGQPLLWRLFLIAFCGIAAFASMEAVFGLWTQANFGWTAHEVGLAFIAVGAAGLAVQSLLIVAMLPIAVQVIRLRKRAGSQ
jgi:hypothetical protein